jgi:hypothetical protein
MPCIVDPHHLTGAFSVWAQDLHQEYATHLDTVVDKLSLKRNFDNSVFACAGANLGPRVTCAPHLDSANLPNGWCAVTAFGQFDHRKGGHMVLEELG